MRLDCRAFVAHRNIIARSSRGRCSRFGSERNRTYDRSMSKRSSGEATGGPSGSLGRAAGRPPTQSLLRFDQEDDCGLGTSLYEAVVCQDTSLLSDFGWLDRLDAITLLEDRLAALKAKTIAGFDDCLRGVSADLGHRYPQPGDRAATAGERRWIAGDLRSVSDEIAGILEMRRGSATTRIHRSCELVHNFPATLAALSAGHLTERAAFTIVRELSVLEDIADIRAAESAVLAWSKTHPLVDIKQACQREAARRSPEATDKAYQRAHDERSVRMYSDDLGRSDIVHNQSSIDGAAVMTSLSRAAIRCRRLGDPRTLDQLRADIALSRLLPRSKRPTPQPQPATRATDPAHTADLADLADPADLAEAADPADLADSADLADVAEPADDAGVPPTEVPGDEPAFEPLGADLQTTDSWCDGPDDPDRDESATLHPANPRSDAGDEHKNTHLGEQTGATSDRFRGTDVDRPDESLVGAEAAVVIHATAAEVRALIEEEQGTGGETDQHGPLPQSALRKYLLKALTQTLLLNLSSTSVSPSTSAEGFAAGGTGVGSRVELQVTDRPPASDPDRYVPSAALDRYVRLRDRTCQFPGCNRPAEFTDLDHRVSFAADGRTTAANLWCLCRHHHRLKHEGGWQIHLSADGIYTWTSPTGRHHPNKRRHRPGNGHRPGKQSDGDDHQSSVEPTIAPS
ncbi:DUF222 domain-containing protein [Kribbella sp. NPDC051620]|uniref:HNH endonuclease signature motif containing protein n=1 Tax=Kribbella sp. NPDC051620 TaxID=3364120 RepID=UPI0037BB0CF1